MGERKVLIKYYPPDFDPSKLKKNRRPVDKQDVVRMMLPMTIRCNICGNYLYIGTKFNMRKETALNETYLGIKVFRFYFKCTVCHAEITFKTDPKNHDYVVEHGGSRNYEAWKDVEAAETMVKEIRQNEEEGNTMKYLENKTYDSKRELEIMDALEEIKEMNKRKAKVTVDQLLMQAALEDEKQEEEEREISRGIIKDRIVKRLIEDDEEVRESKSLYQSNTNVLSQPVNNSLISGGSSIPSAKGIKMQIKVKKVLKEEVPAKNQLASHGSQNSMVFQSEALPVTTGGAIPSLSSQARPVNKLTSLLNYSDDE